MSGSWSSSFNEEMHGAVLCSDMENMVLRMVAGPVSHGSMRMVKDPGKRPGEDTGATGGEKVSRKAVSPLRDRTVNDMAGHNGGCCQNGGETSTSRSR
jgi:hypothetical protein